MELEQRRREWEDRRGDTDRIRSGANAGQLEQALQEEQQACARYLQALQLAGPQRQQALSGVNEA
jgi:hypothetical protein